MKKKLIVLLSLALVACEKTSEVEQGSISGLVASDICSGKIVGETIGTANCSVDVATSGFVAEGLYIFSSRSDSATLDFNSLVDDLWTSGQDPIATREVATLKDAIDGTSLYINNYSVIPRPLDESDGYFSSSSPKCEKSYIFRTSLS
jgi:hypothetical protein